MAQNWWIDNQGVNNLRGVYDDPDNPLILLDDQIIQFVLSNPQAQRDFFALVPTMLPGEQERLNGLVSSYPRMEIPNPYPDPQVIDDRFQARQNTTGVFFDPNRRRR